MSKLLFFLTVEKFIAISKFLSRSIKLLDSITIVYIR